MNNDFHELASAYLDGEATADEAARVEADPELRSQVDALGALAAEMRSTTTPVDPLIRGQHLGAALAAFDDLFGGGAGSGALDSPTLSAAGGLRSVGDDVEIAGARIVRLPGVGPDPDGTGTSSAGEDVPPADSGTGATVSRIDGGRAGAAPPVTGRRRRAGGVPAWLSAAAASVAVLGGAALFATTTGGGNDEAATSAGDSADETDAETFATSSAEAAEADALEAAPAAETADAVRQESEEAAAALSSDDEAPEEGVGDDGGQEDTSVTTLVQPGAVLRFGGVPDEAEVAQQRAGVELSVPEASICGPAVEPPAGTELIGYIEALVDGVSGEVLVYAPPGGGPEVVIVVDRACVPF